MRLSLTLLSFFVLLVGCQFEELLSADEQLEADIVLIKNYLAEQNILDESIETESGLHYYIEEAGNDTIFPDPTSVMYMRYRGYLIDGTQFDVTSARSKCLTFADSCSTIKVNQTVAGFREGLSFFNDGSKGSLFIPSQLGYGSRGTTNIPANSVIIFDVEILDIVN